VCGVVRLLPGGETDQFGDLLRTNRKGRPGRGAAFSNPAKDLSRKRRLHRATFFGVKSRCSGEAGWRTSDV